ncbi:MAG: hypothetical protein HY747_00355 [Elusimicrobia bacterium]|nr:hypothetical protein [Elusimicrobiota bacterium]
MTNFGMDERHCLAVFLLGHPVLKARLKLAPYAALKQRIAFQYHLTGLEQDEIGPYIAYRLKLAGRTRPIFSDEAVTLLFNYSKGLPRMINTLAHEALYRAALEEKTLVDEKTIENIVQEWDSL